MVRITETAVPLLLGVSACLLGVLIPGGPIETRTFSHLAPLILGAFNTFLTVLGVASFFLTYHTYKGRWEAFVASALCGVGYFLVYVLDLGGVFPVSPDPMPPALRVIEVVGTMVSLPLVVLSIRGVRRTVGQSGTGRVQNTATVSARWGVAIFLVAIAIIVFATYSAMRG
ncbi:MAG: hypothetical protein JXQ84_07160 [Rhodospirillaceae bacterium]|nr:hypothetical protein [Rhodospirillaceae bacterium]